MQKTGLFAAAVVAVIVLAAISLFIGVGDVTLTGLLSGEGEQAQLLLAASRIPRTLALILTGSSLAIAGLVLQIIVRNRFVEPSTIGTTESASLGFLIATVLVPAWPMMGKMLIAALFALAGTALFLHLLRRIPPREVLLVPLVGIMLAGVIGAVTTFFAYRFELLPAMLAWNMGDFSGVLRGRYELLWLGLAATLFAWLIADRLTVAGMGEDFSTNLGLNYNRIMAAGLVIVAVISAACLVSTGQIPFLGLIVPNIVSMMIGDNMRSAVPWVAVMGALIVLACDMAGRLIRFPYEIPISVVLGVIGSIVFLWLLLRKRHYAQ
ncbi:MAG: ABC transporter permease [Paracoccus sp. (in: a-proteobacteria)]|nr:ABC transporter permease [Paracoccus sp. (in: a-proteobacteria)]MDO5621043.1 ABC transporter permease [Paracoccus sp. (in: a-proteobacteria)]